MARAGRSETGRGVALSLLAAAALATGAPVVGAVAPRGVAGALAPRQAAGPPEPAELFGYWYTVANGDRVTSVLREGDAVWSGTEAGGVVRWSLASGARRQYLAPQDGLPGNDVRALARDGAGTLWAATSGGLARFDAGGDRWRAVVPPADLAPSPSATALALGAGGRLWVGLEQRWDPDAPAPGVTGGSGAFVGGGLAGFDPEHGTWGPVYRAALNGDADALVDGPPSDNVTAVAVGSDGLVWVGTRPYYRWREDACGRPSCPPELAAWAPDGGGLAAMDASGAFRHWNTRVAEACEASADYTSALAADAGGRMWVATRGRGLQLFLAGQATRLCRPETGHRHFERTPGGLPGAMLWSLARSADGRLWLGVGDGERALGVAVFDPHGTFDVPSPGAPGDDEWALFPLDGLGGRSDALPVALDVHGPELVVGTRDDHAGDGWGVKVREASGAWRTLATAATGLPSSQITAVLADPARGAVWFGTRDRGVARLDGAGWASWGAFDRAAAVAELVDAGVRGASRFTMTLGAAEFGSAFPATPKLVRLGAAPGLYEITSPVAATGGVRVDVRPALGFDLPAGTPVWTVRRGPASDAVTALALDSSGRLWAGGRAGLVRPARPNSGDSRCETFPDCWYDGGLAVYDGQGWTDETPPGAGGRPLRDIAALAFDGQGQLWAGTGDPSSDQGAGVAVRAPEGAWRRMDRASEGAEFGGDVVNGLALDPLTGAMWLATQHARCVDGAPGCPSSGRLGGGVSRWDGDHWSHWAKGRARGLAANGSDGNFSAVLFDAGRARAFAGAWAEGPGGAHWISGVGVDAAVNSCPRACRDEAWEARVFADEGVVRGLAVDSGDRLWVGASRDGRGVVPHRGGALILDGTGWSRQSTDLWSNEVTALAPEGDGMWLGTFDGGAARWRPAVLGPGAYLPAVGRGAGARAGAGALRR